MDKKMAKRLGKWIDNGSQVAVYRNQDMSSPTLGSLVFLKVGGKATFKEAPKRLPDTPKLIGWRYGLETVIKRKKDLMGVV